jgi:hypothetical protein
MAQIILADEPEVQSDNDVALLEPFYSGEEFGVNFAYYASDDEVLDQDVFDEVAYACWRDEVVEFDKED